MENICQRVKEIRSTCKLSQTEFAKRIGVTNAHISKIEKGNTVPSAALSKLICQTYRINESWLLTGEGSMLNYSMWQIEMDTVRETDRLMHNLLNTMGIPRTRTIELQLQFARFVSASSEVELETVDYLNICYKILSHLNQYISKQKENTEKCSTMSSKLKQEVMEQLQHDIEDFENHFARREKQQ